MTTSAIKQLSVSIFTGLTGMLAFAGLGCAAPAPAPADGPFDFSVKTPGDPMAGLPKEARIISAFGERPVISPDGRKIAFVGKSLGDAYEYDIATGAIRNLTAHAPHNGFYRVHYLPDGNYILTGLRKPEERDTEGFLKASADRQIAVEIFFLDKSAAGPIVPLDLHVLEGVALSRTANRIAWVETEPKIPVERFTATTKIETVLKMADIVVRDGRPQVENLKTVASVDGIDDCMLEAQDFRDGDREIVGPCYMLNRKAFPLGSSKEPFALGEKILGFSVATGWRTTYLTTSGNSYYAEVEGMSPDDRFALFECGVRHHSLDICRISLDEGRKLKRLTFGQDYAPIRFSNPTISADGKWMAFQMGAADAEAGTGLGIILSPMPQ